MPQVLLVHWNEAEAVERAKLLMQSGVSVAATVSSGGEVMKTLKKSPGIDAFVISLERIPSHGREVGKFLREVKSTRHLPLIYIEGPIPEKNEKVRQLLPDAIYTSWKDLAAVLENVKPLDNPIVPGWTINSEKPLIQKLGIRAAMKVGLHGAPEEFEELLGEIPDSVRFLERGKADLYFWFVRSVEELLREIPYMSVRCPLWICWPKGMGGLKQPLIRKTAKEVGLVDYKICSISQTWSGMIFKVKDN